MPHTGNRRIEAFAESCVDDMGDIFWDFDSRRDAAGQYTDPREVALEAVKKTLTSFAELDGANLVDPTSLLGEYSTLLADLSEGSKDGALISALVKESDWTKEGATELVRLARNYGWWFLQHAMTLAEAMGIEDGEAGF